VPDESRKLQQCIEDTQNALAALLASGKALTSPEVLALSKCLDRYVLEWYRLEYLVERSALESLSFQKPLSSREAPTESLA
jgi:hypothetical protein